jgi:N-(2-amino-2-carboxyethyl)-L-glutamate synthase
VTGPLANRVSDVVTGRVFVQLPGFVPGFDTTVKLEGLNPAGSIKLKTARGMLDAASAEGLIGPGSELVESTSGNLGIALASICAERGYRVTLVTDPNTNAQSVRHMKAFGATVVVVRERDRNGGYLQTRIDYIHSRLAENPKLFWLNQYANPANLAAHYDGTAREIERDFGLPDWLFVGVGSAGTLMGCVDRFRDIGAPTRIVAVDAVGSVTFDGTAAGRRWIPGIGSSRRPELFRHHGFQQQLVAERDAVGMCRQVALEYGLLLGGSSGAVLAAVRAVRDRIDPGSQVLAVCPDMGDRYLDTVYDDDWVAARFG